MLGVRSESASIVAPMDQDSVFLDHIFGVLPRHVVHDSSALLYRRVVHHFSALRYKLTEVFAEEEPLGIVPSLHL